MKKLAVEKQNKLLREKIDLIKKNSYVSARNYFARELHDVIGHTLVLAMRLCELSIMIYEEDPLTAKEKIGEAVQAVKGGFTELRNNILENDEAISSSIKLKNELEKIINRVKQTNLDVKVYFRGASENIDMDIYEICIRFIQESLTNVLKYAKATTVIVSVKIEEKISIFILDNGVGCYILKKGNGISGLEQRIHEYNGDVEYSYGKNKGFQAMANLPINLSNGH